MKEEEFIFSKGELVFIGCLVVLYSLFSHAYAAAIGEVLFMIVCILFYPVYKKILGSKIYKFLPVVIIVGVLLFMVFFRLYHS